MPIQKILSLQFLDQLIPFLESQRNVNTMPTYECNEHQFVENIRRLIETSQKFLVNRRISWHDDAKYGPAIFA
jgi:polyhydroxyalkanoate synthesis regulator protein